MKNRIVHFEVQADDIDRAMDFYKKTFGWNITKYMSEEDTGTMDYWMISTGEKNTPGINGGMYVRTPERKIYFFDCTIEVEDIDKAIKDIKKNGGTIESEKMEMRDVGWFARAKDTEGNMFGLMQSANKDLPV
jgi:predicted enzyme related to lactoylglutathione lyase